MAIASAARHAGVRERALARCRTVNGEPAIWVRALRANVRIVCGESFFFGK